MMKSKLVKKPPTSSYVQNVKSVTCRHEKENMEYSLGARIFQVANTHVIRANGQIKS